MAFAITTVRNPNDCARPENTEPSPQLNGKSVCTWKGRTCELCQTVWDRIMAVFRYLTSWIFGPYTSKDKLEPNGELGLPYHAKLKHYESILKEIDPEFTAQLQPPGWFSSTQQKGLSPKVKIKALDCLYHFLKQIDNKLRFNSESNINSRITLVDLPSNKTYEFTYVPGQNKTKIAKELIDALKKEYTEQNFKFALRVHCNVATVLSYGLGPIVLERYFVPECHQDFYKDHTSEASHGTKITNFFGEEVWLTDRTWHPEFSQFGKNGYAKEYFYSLESANKAFKEFKNIFGGDLY